VNRQLDLVVVRLDLPIIHEAGAAVALACPSLAFTLFLRELRFELGKLLLKLRYPPRGPLEGRGS
jgi:hypothetical protein